MATENKHTNQHSHWSGGIRQPRSYFGKAVLMPKGQYVLISPIPEAAPRLDRKETMRRVVQVGD
jgi:hypothetical protein